MGRIHCIDGHREYVKTKCKLVFTERRIMVKLMSLSALYYEGWCKIDPNAYFTHILILWPPMHVHFSLFLINVFRLKIVSEKKTLNFCCFLIVFIKYDVFLNRCLRDEF